MGVFKRVCLFVFGLAGLLALTALSLPWVGPWTQGATALLYTEPYFTIVEALVLLCALGFVIEILRALFTRNRKVVQVSKEGADQITVTRDAIASQATHVVEEDGRLRARRVVVDAKPRGHVRVFVRVQPLQTVDVVQEGSELHERLVAGLLTVCGDNVDKVEIEFTDAASYVGLNDDEELVEEDEFVEVLPEDGEAFAAPVEEGITVPMGRPHVEPEAEEE